MVNLVNRLNAKSVFRISLWIKVTGDVKNRVIMISATPATQIKLVGLLLTTQN